MIPFFRSHNELMVITQPRIGFSTSHKENTCKAYSEIHTHKENDKSQKNKIIKLPSLPKLKRERWKKNKEKVLNFFNDLDYNNQIQSTYELTLMQRQNHYKHDDAA